MNEKNRVTVKLEWSCEAYTAELVPLKRKSIYGDRKVIAIDKEDKECSRIMYDESDMTLFPKNLQVSADWMKKEKSIQEKKTRKKSLFLNTATIGNLMIVYMKSRQTKGDSVLQMQKQFIR